jgi:hypothetical protein
VSNEVDTVEFSIKDKDGNDMSKNYNIKYELGTLSIKPLELTYSPYSTTGTYNGQAIYQYDDLTKKSGSYKHILRINRDAAGNCDILFELLDKDGLYAYIQGGADSFLAGKHYTLPTIVMMLNGQNLVALGDVVFTNNNTVTTTISKRSLNIHNETINTFSDDFNPYAPEQLFIENLVSGDVVYIGSEKWEKNKMDYEIIPNMENWGEEDVVFGPEYFSQYVNQSTVHIYRTVSGVQYDVTSCYNISFTWYNVTMKGGQI